MSSHRLQKGADIAHNVDEILVPRKSLLQDSNDFSHDLVHSKQAYEPGSLTFSMCTSGSHIGILYRNGGSSTTMRDPSLRLERLGSIDDDLDIAVIGPRHSGGAE